MIAGAAVEIDTAPVDATPVDAAPAEADTGTGPEQPAIPLRQHFARPRLEFVRRRRAKRFARRAAVVAFVAAFGAIAGALIVPGRVPTPVKQDAAVVAERRAIQNTIAGLSRELASLRTGIENANKSANAQFAKISERIERIDRAAEITGSVTRPTAPATLTLATATSGKTIESPLPLPLPRPRVLKGWSLHEARDGAILAGNRGDYFDVVKGVSLPGLGPVEAIRRDGGTLVVVTAKGLIVQRPRSTAGRRYRSQFYFSPD
jgi:hypothetical protein